MKFKLLLLSFLFSATFGWGQVNLAVGGTYNQNFDGLGTASIATYTNNTTLAGWYITSAGLPVNTGTTNANSCYNFGVLGTNPLSDRALGAISTATTHRFGLRLLNNGASDITSFNVSFTGEQWRSFNAGNLVFEYQTGTTVTSITAGTWTALAALNFSSLATSGGAAMDGNAPANRTAVSATLTVSVPAGTEIFFRWSRIGSSSPGLAIDDLSVVANGGCSSAAITGQPSTTVQNLCQSAAATALSVTATGTTLSYQWYSNTTATTSGGTAVGTNSASYTPSTAATGTLYYYCVVTAACGAPVTSSVSGAVNVTAIPAAPAGTINISANPSCGAATLTYSAPNANIYWQTTAGGTSTANPTTSSFMSLATAGTYTRYVRELSGTCWSPATASASFTIVEPIAITAQPPNRVITDGTNTTFTVTATGTTPTYQWQVDTTGTGTSFVDLANGAPYSNVTTATLNITSATIGMNGYLYRCIVSGAAPCGSVTSNSGSLTVSLTAPNNPTAIVPCYGNNTLGLSWTASSGGSAPDGYMVFALAGAATPAATSAVAGNANLYTANSDFSLATVVTASLGKCLYKGTGTSFTVTGLTNLSSYSFKVVAYRGATGTAWSTGINTNGSWNTPTTNIAIDMPEVSALAASIASGQSALTWTRPTPLACYDEYLVVANQGAVVFTPSGDGTAYTANSVYSGANQVVYKGTGTGVTVTGLTNGTNYCYKVFVRRGTEWSDGVSVCQTPNLVYCSLTATNTGFEHITNVTVGTDINNNTASSGYANYTAQVANTTIGSGTPISVTVTPSYTTDNVYAFVDWNQDGDWLDAGETIAMTYTAVATTFTATGTITPPVTALTGNTRMRVIVVDGTVTNACNGGANFTYGEVEDYTINVLSACVPTHTVTSFTPTSGPVGTEVTINGTGLTGATVSFSGVNATIVSNTGTQMVVVIPAGATTGMLSVKDTQPCAVDNAYTVITKNNTSCEGVASTTDLIIYDIHDEETGSGGFITLYNGTAATVDLTNYSIWRTTNHDDGNEIDYANLTGTIAPGTLGILKVSVGSCGPASTNGTIDGGFNENDGIQLRNAAGTVVIDDVDTYPTAPGYYMVRNTGALSARVSYVAADWSTTPLGPGVCYPSAGLVLPSSTGTAPVVTAQPTYTPSCGSTSATLTTAGTEGFAGGLTLAYQWYFVAPGSATWTAVTDGGIYSGATTASLTISTVSTVSNYQYYCQIRENLATCYTATNAVKIAGSNATTWNGTTWSNGVPTVSKLAIINGNYNTAVNGDFECCSLQINATYTLDIKDTDYVLIQNDLTVNGTLEVQNQGSLIMVSDTGVVTNNGTTNVRKMSTLFDKYDYTFWSSPVANAPISIFSQWQTNYIFKLNTAAFRDDNNDSHDDNMDAWVFTPQAEIMSAGRGYAAMGKIAQTFPAQQGAVYSGAVNNGVVTQPIALSLDNTKANDDFNLIGNPYPSAISADAFITSNPDISGTLYFWTHEGNIQVAAINPGPMNMNFSPDDFAYYNLAGGTGTRAGLLSGNGNSNAPSGFIASGQGFQVDADAATFVTFNNAMRNKTHINTDFYRDATAGPAPQKDRIWLNLTNSEGIFSQQLIGFFPQATMGVDRGYDGYYTKSPTYAAFYSMIGNTPYKIQGRSAFDVNDRIPLGFRSAYEKTYTVSIGDIQGVLTNQNVYLEDLQLNVIHDLKASNYVFSTPAGEFNNRFVLRFTNTTLGNDDFQSTANSLIIYANQGITVTSSLERIKDVVVYDVLGRLITDKKNVNHNETVLTNVRPTQSALIVKVTLENGQTVTKKVLY